MDFLDRVVKEILRLYPSAPVFARELIEELEINGVILPVGTSLNLSVYDLHRDPQHFPDPLRFDPDRFLPELVEKRHPFAYLPFMAGPRNCIGTSGDTMTHLTPKIILYLDRPNSPRMTHFKKVL